MDEQNKIQLYITDDGQVSLDVRIDEETVWLTLNQIGHLFDRDKSVISRHISNIYKENELQKDSTVAKFATVQIEGDRNIQRVFEYYSLDVIISVGYRVKSKRGTQFRIWANRILKQYLLLYFLVKNHSFVDGNKRIAAAIFLWFMHKNGLLFDKSGEKILDDSALVGITLMIAGSNPKERELIINVVLNLLNIHHD